MNPSRAQRVACAIIVVAVSCTSAALNAKRGFVADGCVGASCKDIELLSNIGWYYAYKYVPSLGIRRSPLRPLHPAQSPHDRAVGAAFCSRPVAHAPPWQPR